jgi:hypothetical protein
MTAVNNEVPLTYLGHEQYGLDYVETQRLDVLDFAGSPSDYGNIIQIVPPLDEVRQAVADAYVEQDVAVEHSSYPGNDKGIAKVIHIEDGELIEPPVATLARVQEDRSVISTLQEKVTASPEQPKMRIRAATPADIPALVDIDMRAFSRVYNGYDMSEAEMRADLEAKFLHRYNVVGGRWMSIVDVDGEPGGFIMSCPTNKLPENFQSWEETTDNGTLDSTYDPNGKNIYIVSLSVLPKASQANAQDVLIADTIGKFIESGMDRGYFESRLPGLRTWASVQCRREGMDINQLTENERLDLANRYFRLTTTVDGKEVPRDRLIRLYSSVGCEFIKVVPDAYQDEPSMNFGAVGVYENPLPAVVRKSRLASKVAGKAVQLAARSPKLLDKVL